MEGGSFRPIFVLNVDYKLFTSIMDHIQKSQTKAIVISMDAKKAFDSISYMYLVYMTRLLKPYRHCMTIPLLGLKSMDIFQIVLA